MKMELKLRNENRFILDNDGNVIFDPAGKRDKKGNIKRVENPERISFNSGSDTQCKGRASTRTLPGGVVHPKKPKSSRRRTT